MYCIHHHLREINKLQTEMELGAQVPNDKGQLTINQDAKSNKPSTCHKITHIANDIPPSPMELEPTALHYGSCKYLS